VDDEGYASLGGGGANGCDARGGGVDVELGSLGWPDAVFDVEAGCSDLDEAADVLFNLRAVWRVTLLEVDRHRQVGGADNDPGGFEGLGDGEPFAIRNPVRERDGVARRRERLDPGCRSDDACRDGVPDVADDERVAGNVQRAEVFGFLGLRSS